MRRGKEPDSICKPDQLLFIAAQLDLIMDLSLEKHLEAFVMKSA